MAITYKDAGVDITAGNLAVEKMKSHVKKTFRPEVLTDLGSFAGLFALNTAKYQEPVLVSGTDGVGTKLKVAMMMQKHDTIGIDAVAMCVNDILVQGAEPLFFLDYIAIGKLEPEKVASLVKGVAEGCLQAGCSLIGGETAEMPGLYQPDDYDVAGFAVGVVDRSKIINGAKIKAGDVMLGLASNGLHSNGYSLARKVIFEAGGYGIQDMIPELGVTAGIAMLEPTKIYVKEVLPLLEKINIKGMAHITGGGIIENIPRVFPANLVGRVYTDNWQRPEIFNVIQKIGQVPENEMYRVFNMGVGFVLIVSPEDVAKTIELCPQAFKIGDIDTCPNEAHIELISGQIYA